MESTPHPSSPAAIWLSRMEWLAALVLLALAVWLRVDFVQHAGGLWRDEAGSVALANLPTFAEVFANLEHESFPIVWPLVLRAVSAVAGDGDLAWRMLGLAFSLGTLALLCVLGWRLNRRAPIIALTLLGLNLTLVQWGSTARGHGAGVFMGLLAVAAFLRVAFQPGVRTGALAIAAATLAVQTLYYNAVIVLAAAAGLAAVAALRRDARGLWCGLAAGGVSALSLLIYAEVFQRGSDWKPLVEIARFDAPLFLSQLGKVLVGPRASALWLGLIAIALVSGTAVIAMKPRDAEWDHRRGTIVFAIVTLGVAVLAYYFFLETLRYPTQVWYYLALLVPVGFCLDLALVRLAQGAIARVLLLAVAAGGVRLLLPYAREAAPMRLTNMDLIARKIAARAAAADLVVANPWYLGVSYSRYHASPAPWICVPPLASTQMHRYDLVRPAMLEPDQAEPTRVVRERIRETLLAGGRVYLIGAWDSAEKVPELPAAPRSPSGWLGDPYFRMWRAQIVSTTAAHAARVEIVPIHASAPICPYENPSLVVAEGWRE